MDIPVIINETDPSFISGDGGESSAVWTKPFQSGADMPNDMNGDVATVLVKRERSSFSDSQLDAEFVNLSNDMGDTRKTRDWRQRRSKSLYGTCPNFDFGPKASLLQTQDSILTIQDPMSQTLTWCKPPQTVLIIKKILDDAVDEPFVELAEWLLECEKMDVYVEQKVLDDPLIKSQDAFRRIINKLSKFSEGQDDLTGKIDIIICLGGDGTLLYASTLFQASVPPVMAFHLGSLGFLSPFDFSNYQERVSRVLQGRNVPLMLRSRLKCHITPGSTTVAHDDDDNIPRKHHFLVLNEVVVDRGATPYLCQLDLRIQDRQVTVVQGDGVIISTPTGSTAYAAAAGASMVHPNVPAIVIAPICPHSLSFRPIVVPAGVEIKITVPPDARSGSWASFDGRNRQHLEKGDTLVICTSKYPLPSICCNDPISDWFDSLAGCLHWNDRKAQLPLRSPAPDGQTNNIGHSVSQNGKL